MHHLLALADFHCRYAGSSVVSAPRGGCSGLLSGRGPGPKALFSSAGWGCGGVELFIPVVTKSGQDVHERRRP